MFKQRSQTEVFEYGKWDGFCNRMFSETTSKENAAMYESIRYFFIKCRMHREVAKYLTLSRHD